MSKDKSKTILIIAARQNRNRRFSGGTITNELMLNIGSRLCIEILIDHYTKNNWNIFVAAKKIDEVAEHHWPLQKANWIEIDETRSINETIAMSLRKITTEKILIQPISTLNRIESEPNGRIIYAGRERLYRENWSGVCTENNKLRILHKENEKDYGKKCHPLTGMIFGERKLIQEAAKESVKKNEHDLSATIERLLKIEDTRIELNDWLDTGHTATYVKARTTKINCRAFNNLIYNFENDTITKKDDKAGKVKREKEYYLASPKQFRRYFPAIDDTSKEDLTMEYIGLPTLAELYLHEKIGPNSWTRIMTRIDRIIDSFYGDQSKKTKADLGWLYTEKTSNRINELKTREKQAPSPISVILKKEYRLNGKLYPPLAKSIEKIMIGISKHEREREACFGHGDLCFNNILADPLMGTIKLIDPKAHKSNSEEDIGAMEINYDIAKLNHSIKWNYDSIANQLYNLKAYGEDNFEMCIYESQEKEILTTIFKESICRRVSMETMELITANLFISMLPLHYENKDKQLALAFIAGQIMGEMDK